MKSHAQILPTVLLAASSLDAVEFRNVTCEGTYQHHLRGICAAVEHTGLKHENAGQEDSK